MGKKIFATLPTPQSLRVFVDEESIQSAVQRHPDCCEPVRWGAKVLGVAFDLDVAGHELVEEYLTQAWASRATPRLLAQLDSRTHSS
ncbi:hypothetical protein [Jatrophihabitans sp.]|uniref:hypothetical protein n=1 Tax=Jatrophihabitans sp. TaxID=1932789 RepID=UPI0038CDA42F